MPCARCSPTARRWPPCWPPRRRSPAPKAAAGLVPKGLAPALARIKADDLDLAALGARTRDAGVAAIPFVKAIEALLPEKLARPRSQGRHQPGHRRHGAGAADGRRLRADRRRPGRDPRRAVGAGTEACAHALRRAHLWPARRAGHLRLRRRHLGRRASPRWRTTCRACASARSPPRSAGRSARSPASAAPPRRSAPPSPGTWSSPWRRSRGTPAAPAWWLSEPGSPRSSPRSPAWRPTSPSSPRPRSARCARPRQKAAAAPRPCRTSRTRFPPP